MVRSSLVTARYGDPERVRLWQFTLSGDARCLVDAPLVSDLDPAVLARVEGAAALIRYGLELAEAHEAALRVPEPDESIPRELPLYTYDEDGEQTQTGTEPHPQWAAYDTAQATIASATPDLLHLVTLRAGEPPQKTVVVDEETGEEADTPEWVAYQVAQARLAEAVSSIIETAPPLTSPDALPEPVNPPDFLP